VNVDTDKFIFEAVFFDGLALLFLSFLSLSNFFLSKNLFVFLWLIGYFGFLLLGQTLFLAHNLEVRVRF